jgi:secondary thiamine-phosphate synthase enzyme
MRRILRAAVPLRGRFGVRWSRVERGSGFVFQTEIELATKGRGTYELTARVADAVRSAGVATGLCHVFTTHTSASLMICENADPDVRRDLETFMSDLAPDGDPRFVHTAEGPDDMSAHVRSVLTTTDLTIPIRGGALALGTWQGVYLWEHRTAAHRRRVIVTILG